MLIDKLQARVRVLDLDLSGKVVLTEAATGAYVVTPVLAALAGAKVYAYVKDTRYGTKADAIDATKKVLAHWQGDLPEITFLDELSPDVIASADVITNSGHLRPLNEAVLRYAKNDLVIPLMYEAWEWRNADMDLSYIRKRGFRLGATNERHPDVDVFNFLGDMAIRQILDAGLCLYDNKFVLICNNDFGPFIAKVLSKVCGGLGVIDVPANRHAYNFENVHWIGDFPAVNIPDSYRDAEAVIFTAYPFTTSWIGNNGEPMAAKQFKKNFRHAVLLRYAGDMDTDALTEKGMRYFPQQVCPGHMGVLPSSIGYEPVIRLQAGGLKAAEAMLSGNAYYKNIPILQTI